MNTVGQADNLKLLRSLAKKLALPYSSVVSSPQRPCTSKYFDPNEEQQTNQLPINLRRSSCEYLRNLIKEFTEKFVYSSASCRVY